MSPLYIDESVQRVNSLICVLIAARRDDSHVDPAQLLDELIQLQGFAYSVRDSIMEAKEAALAEPEQEPVADLCERICAAIKAADDKSVDEAGYMLDSNDCIAIVRRVFGDAAPTPRKPLELTDEEIALLVGECAASAYRHDDFSFARAVIAAYEKKQGGQHE